MADIDHVLEGLACLKEPYEVPDEDCEACHYNPDSCPYDIAGDAYELLKKQTPMDIKPLRDSWPPQGVCPSCFTTIARYTVTGREQPYCAFCGQAVKWND